MSKLKQLQLEIAHLIDNTTDQEEIVNMFLEVRGTQAAALRAEVARKIIDWKTIYGHKLDEAIGILLNPTHENNLTDGKNVPTQDQPQHEEECGK